MAKTWLDVFMDDLEKDYKIEKIKKIIDVIIIITIYNAFIYLFFKWKNIIHLFIFEHKPVTKQAYKNW